MGRWVLPLKFCSINISSLKLGSQHENSPATLNKAEEPLQTSKLHYLLLSDLQHLGKIGWREEPLPADLRELLGLGRAIGATSHTDELFWNNLSNAADTNRLPSNAREAWPTFVALAEDSCRQPSSISGGEFLAKSGAGVSKVLGEHERVGNIHNQFPGQTLSRALL